MRLKSDFGKWDLREGQTKPVLASGFGKWDWQVGSKFFWQVGIRGGAAPRFRSGSGGEPALQRDHYNTRFLRRYRIWVLIELQDPEHRCALLRPNGK